METIYTSLNNNRVRAPRSNTPRYNNDKERIRKLEIDNFNLTKKLEELTKLKNDLEQQYERVLDEKQDVYNMLSGELDFNNEMTDKYNKLLKRSISQDMMLNKSKSTRSTPKVSRRAISKPPSFSSIHNKGITPPKKRKSTLSKKSSGNIN